MNTTGHAKAAALFYTAITGKGRGFKLPGGYRIRTRPRKARN